MDQAYFADRSSCSLRFRAHFSVAILFTAITASGGMAVFAHASWPGATNITTDHSDELPAVIGTGDFNHDGIADMIKVISLDGKESSPRSLAVLLGKADGTFIPQPSHYPISGDPRALAVGDFNADRNLDVIVGEADGVLHEFLGDGKGNMTDTGDIANLGSVASIAIGRFTQGENLDIVVSDSSSNSAVILLGAGNGSFRRAWSFQLPRKGREFQISTADFNKDGISDLAITSEDDSNYEVMIGNGNGTFTYAPELSHLRDPNSYCPS